jgi:hypothetical protein
MWFEDRTAGTGMKRLAIISASVIALTAATPAFGDDLTGNWLFGTSKFAQNDCQITGHITFNATSIKNTYTCKFESEQTCGPADDNLYIRVQQVCTAQRVGNNVTIKATVDKVLERRPKIDHPELSYLADNFIVQMQTSLVEMIGQHNDELRQLKVRFWRDTELFPGSGGTPAPH